jgi:hypothetical protein
VSYLNFSFCELIGRFTIIHRDNLSILLIDPFVGGCLRMLRDIRTYQGFLPWAIEWSGQAYAVIGTIDSQH